MEADENEVLVFIFVNGLDRRKFQHKRNSMEGRSNDDYPTNDSGDSLVDSGFCAGFPDREERWNYEGQRVGACAG
jgi:hypothetical protein